MTATTVGVIPAGVSHQPAVYLISCNSTMPQLCRRQHMRIIPVCSQTKCNVGGTGLPSCLIGLVAAIIIEQRW